MTTRTRDRQPSEDQEVVDLAPVDLDTSAQRLVLLPELVQSMGATAALERPAVATRINHVLIAMRAPGHEAEESELLLDLLSTKVLNDQLDTEGRSCRKEIVETLMACGFPHALMLDPDDLRFAREFRASRSENSEALDPWERSMRFDRRVGGAVMVLAQVNAAVLSLPETNSVPLQIASAVLFGAGILAGLLLAVRRPRDLNIATFGSFATLLMVAGLVLAALIGSGSTAIGAAGIGLGLFVAIVRLFQPRADGPRPYYLDHPRKWW